MPMKPIHLGPSEIRIGRIPKLVWWKRCLHHLFGVEFVKPKAQWESFGFISDATIEIKEEDIKDLHVDKDECSDR